MQINFFTGFNIIKMIRGNLELKINNVIQMFSQQKVKASALSNAKYQNNYTDKKQDEISFKGLLSNSLIDRAKKYIFFDNSVNHWVDKILIIGKAIEPEFYEEIIIPFKKQSNVDKELLAAYSKNDEMDTFNQIINKSLKILCLKQLRSLMQKSWLHDITSLIL